MNFLSHLLRAGYFFVLIELINSYLLIAANLNDFRTIAQKLVPEDFANRLTKVISNPVLGKVSGNSYENNDYEESDNVSDNNHPNLKVNVYKKSKVNLDIEGTKVDFDELVERVKKRIEEELKNKYIKKQQNDKATKTKIKKKEYEIITDKKSDKIKVNNYQKVTSPIPDAVDTEEEPVYETLNYEEPVTEKPKNVQQVTKLTTKEDRYEYAVAMVDSEVEEDKQVDGNEKKTEDKIYYDIESVTQNDLYKKVDMVKKDSYEDYKIPAKKNVYSSSEKQNNKRFKIEQRQKSTGKVGYHKYVSQIEKSEEIAAVTADLLYDYNDTEIISDEDRIEKNNKAIDKKLGTMIPKREFYTIITPNYLDKVPNVVEKYNFNEPIPERDQEREIVKYYGNPPASVNKKDNGLDRGAYSDRGGLWFGPRLGKRSLQLTDEDKSDTFLRLLEAAEVLKTYNDEMHVNAPRKDDMRVIFTPKFTRAANRSGARKHYDFTPRLGRKLQEKLSAPPPQEENAIPDSVIINPVVTNPGNNYFSPRLGRNYDFTPRLGREVYDLYPETQETQIRVARSINGTNSD